MDSNNIKCVNLPFKSTVWIMILSLFLGPLGVAYVSLKVSIIMLVVTLIGLALSKHLPYLIYLIWIVNFYLSIYLIEKHNKQLLEKICL